MLDYADRSSDRGGSQACAADDAGGGKCCYGSFMKNTGANFMGMPIFVDAALPDGLARFAPPVIPPDVLNAIQRAAEEMEKSSSITSAMTSLHRKSLHGQYAVRFVLDEGEMRAIGPFPLWQNSDD